MLARRSSLAVLVGVSAGNLLASRGLLNLRMLIPLSGAAFWLICAPARPDRRTAAICIGGLVLGALAVMGSVPDRAPLAELAGEVPECTAQGVVLEARAGLGTFGEVHELVCEGSRKAERGVLVFESDQAFSGAPFVVQGRLVPLGSSEFDGARSDAGAAAFITGRAHFAPPKDPWRRLALSLRNGLTDASEVLPVREGALLSGLTIGDTSRMGPADEEIYRDTGLSHLVAVSGSNIAIVVGSVLVLLGRVRLWLRLLAGATTLVLYVTVVGPDASVLRAAAMGLLALLALAFGRRHEVLSTLAYAIAALLVVRPEMITSLGLQLSAAATAGLGLWSGSLSAWFGRLPRPVAFALAATLAAQVAVAPLLVHYFERVSLIGPISNLLALPAVGGATLLGLGSGVLGTLWTPLGELLALAAYPFVWWIVRVADLSAVPTWSSAELDARWAVPLGLLALAAALATRRPRSDLVT